MRLEWSETVAKERLKRMGRFELLELIYQLKKSNEELTLRCREAEKQLDTLTRESTQREEKVRREFVTGKGTQFDPEYADTIIEMIDEDKDYELREK